MFRRAGTPGQQIFLCVSLVYSCHSAKLEVEALNCPQSCTGTTCRALLEYCSITRLQLSAACNAKHESLKSTGTLKAENEHDASGSQNGVPRCLAAGKKGYSSLIQRGFGPQEASCSPLTHQLGHHFFEQLLSVPFSAHQMQEEDVLYPTNTYKLF